MINWQDIAVGLGLSLLLAFVTAQLVARALRLGLSAVTGDTEQRSFSDPIQHRPIQVVRAIVFLATLLLLAPPILEALGVELPYGIPLEQVTTPLLQGSLRVALIAVLTYFSIRVASLGIAHFERVVRERTKAFDAQGIEIPFPHTSLYFGEASKPFLAQTIDAAEAEHLATSKPDKLKSPARRSTSAATDADTIDTGDMG